MDAHRSSYRIDSDRVLWKNEVVDGADAESFKPLAGSWARDRRAAYWAGAALEADTASFVALNAVFAVDGQTVFDCQGAVIGADPGTFRVLDSGLTASDRIASDIWARGYGRDSCSVYFHDQLDDEPAAELDNADADSFVSLRNDFGVDSSSVWYRQWQVASADPATWIPLGRGWSIDHERVFYGHEEISDANPQSLTVVHGAYRSNFATDGDRYFANEQEISEADFWQQTAYSFSNTERHFRVAYDRIRSTCERCDGTGDCYCKRKGRAGNCARCGDTGDCHFCNGRGRLTIA